MADVVDMAGLVKQVIDQINQVSTDKLCSKVAGEINIDGQLSIKLSAGLCQISNSELQITLKKPELLQQINTALCQRLGYNPFEQKPATNNADFINSIPGIINLETVSVTELINMAESEVKSSYSHDEVFGQFCFLGDHINVPYDMAFDYVANVHSLEEWTIGLRNFRHLGGGLYHAQEGLGDNPHDIFLRADIMKGKEHGIIFHPCAWDQGQELWMRYYLVFIDSQQTLNKPGTILIWFNCRHPYYDQSFTNVPDYIAAGRVRPNRQWIGDLWHLFNPIHRIELNNLKRILEYRFQHRLPNLARQG